MFTQFFGNYLLSKDYVSQEQLFSAMQKTAQQHIKLGTLAIDSGLMTASEVDQIIIRQTHENKKFGELAIEMGLLSNEQVIELLNTQTPDYLLLGQTLVDDGILSNSELEIIIADYKSKNEMVDLDMTVENREDAQRLFEDFYIYSENPITTFGKMYMELFFNSLIRFVGEDFTPLPSNEITEFATECCSVQAVLGDYRIKSYLNMDEATAIKFASRYADEDFMEYDEYVEAALQDFVNLHNGLFVVNCSNEYSTELSIDTPYQLDNEIVQYGPGTYHFPILYSFGSVHFILEVIKTMEIEQ